MCIRDRLCVQCAAHGNLFTDRQCVHQCEAEKDTDGGIAEERGINSGLRGEIRGNCEIRKGFTVPFFFFCVHD